MIKSAQGKATFTHENVVNIYIANEINLWQFTVGKDFTLGKSSFGAAKLTKYTEFDKNKYSGYGTEFDSSWSFLFSDGGGFSKNIIVFGADMSSSVHTGNKKKDSLIFGNDPADCLDDTTLNAEKI